MNNHLRREGIEHKSSRTRTHFYSSLPQEFGRRRNEKAGHKNPSAEEAEGFDFYGIPELFQMRPGFSTKRIESYAVAERAGSSSLDIAFPSASLTLKSTTPV